MTRLSMALATALLWYSGSAHAWQQKTVNPKSWSGVIINSGCTPDEAFAEADKCFEKRGSPAKLSFYDDTTRQIYELDAQDQAARYFGDSVTVEGDLNCSSIRVSHIRKLTSIGLAVGQRAPALSAPDQFGKQQTLETLRGPKGTVLLFFRSADW